VAEGIELFIEMRRKALNRTLLAAAALRWIAVASLVGAAAAAIAYLLFPDLAGRSGAGWLPALGPALAAWAAATLAGAVAGLARGWKGRLDDGAAAAWIDQRIGSAELVSAAYYCLGRSLSGPYDAELVARAEAEIGIRHRIGAPAGALVFKPPRHVLISRALFAAAALLVSAALIESAAWLSPRLHHGRVESQASAFAEGGFFSIPETASRPGERAEPSAPDMDFGSLFPEDPALAGLAERAFREGRIEDLRSMLKKAEGELERRVQRDGDRGRARRELEALRKTESELEGAGAGRGREDPSSAESARASEPGLTEDGEPGQGGGQGEGKAPQGGGSGGAGSPDGISPPGKKSAPGRGEGGDEAESPSDESSPGSGSPGGGSAPGTGSGRAKDWGRIEPGAKAEEAEIPVDPEAAFYSYVLRERASEGGLSEALADAERSAEAAISRNSVPVDYGSFVRSYFLELARKISRFNSVSGGGEDED
jgi:hypothetical protein